MDFSTHDSPAGPAAIPADPPRDPLSVPLLMQVRQALAAVATVTPDHLLSDPHVGEALHRLSRTRLTDRYGYDSRGRRHRTDAGMHAHVTHEVCLPLSGQPAMETAHGVYDLSPPALALITPGMAHCERRTSRREAYSVLWLNTGQTASLASINAYDPRQSWYTAERFSIAGKPAAQIAAALPHMDDPHGHGFEEFRLALLAVLTEIYRKALVGRPVPRLRGQMAAQHVDLLRHVAQFIDQHLDKPLRLDQLADMVHLSPNHLNALFRRWADQPLRAWIIRRRMEKALALLQQPGMLAKQVARQVGYDDPLYFSRAFNRHFGYWPSEARPTAGHLSSPQDVSRTRK